MMNKKLWVGAYLVSLLIVIATLLVGAVVGVLLYDEIIHPRDFAVPMIALGIVAYLQFVVVHTIITLVMLFKIWNVIQDGVTPVTLGKAIGFLFIPFYNLYWIFRVWSGYPKDYDSYIDRYRLGAPKLSATLFTLFPILVLLTAILILPILVLPFVTLFLIARACDAVNNLTVAKSAATEGRPIGPGEFIGTPENARSRTPIYALIGAFTIAAVFVIGFGVFAWFNFSPKPSADLVPPKVGDFALQPGGRTSGSFLGGRKAFWDYIYVSDTDGRKKALEYNIEIHPSDSRPKQWIASMCSSNPGAIINDSAGNEAGKICPTGVGEGLFIQQGNKTIRIVSPDSYDLKKLEAVEATREDIIAFAKTLPLNAGLVFPELSMATTATTTPTSTTPSTLPPVSRDATPDFTFTGQEFYAATNGKDKTALSKYNGKIVQVTARAYSTSSSSVMLQAGKDSIWLYFEPADAGPFEQAKKDERLIIKCAGEVSYSFKLSRCILIENKKVVSAGDTPDVTFTADEFWNVVGSYDLPTATRTKKWEELRGKTIRLTGRFKNVSGDTANLAAGDNHSIGCQSDPENAGMFSGLTEGQNVTLLSVHGVASLEHCIVINK